MASAPKNVKRRDDDDELSSEVGDPWQEMKLEDELQEVKERESRRKAAQNELLGDLDVEKWKNETGLVVPIKHLVQFAGRGRDIKERRQSAFGFAHFSTEDASQQQITDFDNDYGIDALLSLLESDDNICRRYSSLALGNIVSNKRFATKCIEFGVLEAMLPLAIDEATDLETRRYCMLAVANMAAEELTHATILKSLQHVIILIDSFDEEIQKCATLCIQNLSSSREIVLQLQDAIQPLVNLLSITKGKHIPLPDAKLHSVAALRGLCVADVLRLTIINEGVLRAFLQIIDNPPSNAILVEISAILCGFSSLYETHVDLLQPAVLHSIFLLAMGDIIEAQQFGSTTLANLASNSANHDKLIDANAICNLLIMCDYTDYKVKSSSTRALTNFASNTKLHKTLLDEGCLQVMIRMLSTSASNCSASNQCNMFCALFFSILCANHSLHDILCIAEIIQPLFHLIVLQRDDDQIETIRYSVLALANIAHCGQSHPFILSEIEIQMNSFFSLALFDKDTETQRYFGLLLSNLAENVNAHALLSTPVALGKIVSLLEADLESNIEVVLNCISYVLKLLGGSTKQHETIRLRISHMLSEILCNLSSKHNEELAFMIAAYFSNITTSQQVRKELNWDDIVRLMGDMVRQDDAHQDIHIHAMNTLANLRDVNDAVHIMVVETDILSLIVRCMQSPIMDIHSSALRLMSGVSSHEIAIAKLIDLKCIQLIGPFVRSPHSAFRKYAYICLANYASFVCIDLNDVNLIKCYLNLSIDEAVDSEEMRCCLFALANTAYHEPNNEIIAESGILINKTLIDYVAMANGTDLSMNEYASLLLSNCSSTVLLATHAMFGYHDVIQMTINLCTARNGTQCTVLNAIKCLRNLAFHDQHIHVLLECKIIDFIVQFIKGRKEKTSPHKYSPAIDRELAGLVYNLASHPSCIEYIARNDLILCVTGLLISNECDTRGDAARALTCISQHTEIATPLFLKHKECLDYILSALKFNDDFDLYHSLAVILGYIFSLKQVQNGTSYAVTRTHILSLLRKSQSREIQLAALWATSTGSDAVIMGDDQMLQIIASLAEPQLPNEDTNESPLLLKIIRRRALITLVNYAKNEENQRLIIQNCGNVIGNAFNLDDCHDMDVILLSAMLLSNLSQSLNAQIHEQMIAHHDISALDLYLGYKNDNIRIFATRTLSAVCSTPKYAKALIICEKMIPLMCVTTTARNHLLLKQQIASFFQNLTRHEKLIALILQQHLIPTLIELLKTNVDRTIRTRVIAALQNCCCCCVGAQTLERMIEVQNGVPFLWNLLVQFGGQSEEMEFISSVIQILSLFTQRNDCKEQLLSGLCVDETVLCGQRLKALLSCMSVVDTEGKVCIAKILRELSAATELHSLWMDHDLVKDDSLSYLTIDSLFAAASDTAADELIEIVLTVLSQLLLYPQTVCKLLEFNQIRDDFSMINEFVVYANHGWKSIRTLCFNVTAYVMEYVQANNEDRYSSYLCEYYVTSNGLGLIVQNAKISDIGLQAQSARLLAVFSCMKKECVDRLNNDDMFALLHLLAEQSWRVGGGNTKDVHVIHLSVVTILSNMVMSLGAEFLPQNTNLMAAILRYIKDCDHEIRSLALICVCGRGAEESQISPLFSIWDDPLAMLMDALQEAAVNVQCNVMKALVLLSQNDANDLQSMLKLLILYAQSPDSYVRYLALIALKNIIEQEEQLRYDETLIHMIQYQLSNNNRQQQKSEELVLLIVSFVAKMKSYQAQLLEAKIVASLIGDIVLRDTTTTPPHHTFLCGLTLYHLSLGNKEVMQCLINEAAIECALYIALSCDFKHCYVTLSCIANLCTLNDCRVISGREQVHHPKLPLFTLETLHELCNALQEREEEEDKTMAREYSLHGTHRLIALIASRITSHPGFALSNLDLCYLKTIICYLSCGTDFCTQSCALISFFNFLCKSSGTMWRKIVSWAPWMATLLCLVESTNLSVRNVALSCILRICEKETNEAQLLRFLDDLCCDSHFARMVQQLVQSGGGGNDEFSLVAMSRILLILCSNVALHNSLLMKENDFVLCALIELTLDPAEEIQLNGAAALCNFLSCDVAIAHRILSCSAERGLIAFYQMISVKNKIMNGRSIGAIVLCALSSLSNGVEFCAQLASSTHNGLAILHNQILHGAITQEAAQILRNVCRSPQNIKMFLREDGAACLLKLIEQSHDDVAISLLAAATLSDIICHCTTATSIVLTTQHLSPYMSTITHCLLHLLGRGDRCATSLLHKLCADSDKCKRLVVEAGGIKPLLQQYKNEQSDRTAILTLLQCFAAFCETQIQFVKDNGDEILHHLVNNKTHHYDAVLIIASLAKNTDTHPLIADRKIYSFLLTLRHSPHNEARKLAMQTLLSLFENQRILPLVKDDVDLAQTLAAISKFGASKQIKVRSAKIIKNMVQCRRQHAAAAAKENDNKTHNNNNKQSDDFWHGDDDDETLNCEEEN